MALVAKRLSSLTPAKNEQGQISIFFSASLVVFISIIAFVINVGLFVKAKINLQNATDSAAYAGAAVQARQLTKIAYLNWELRNIYKEWMYKYYVVGSLNVPMVENPSGGNTCANGKCMDFRLITDTNVLNAVKSYDYYNYPATCIHIAGAGSKTNICKRYAVPGLPEFGGYNIPGTEEASRQFIDTLIGEKVNDCGSRSQLNMLVTTMWAYNVLTGSSEDSLAGKTPPILTDRQGAWPKAVELAMRIRNLEKVVNYPAESSKVCIGAQSKFCPSGSKFIDEISRNRSLGSERIVKAFYSGYRNLGNHLDNEMKESFALTELPPKPYVIKDKQYSNSNLLIPSPKRYDKQYLDLKVMMVNLATFYAALIPRADTETSGACSISKVGIPVPGYPLGFYKNPDVLTYYAVKGEADFTGMFNPFSQESIKLTAYAAAKPMGGRIGPMLFYQKANEDSIKTRSSGRLRSVPYVSTINVEGTKNVFLGHPLAAGEYGPGVPLPVNLGNPFWFQDSNSAIGGVAQGAGVMFGHPNLVYDFINGDMNPNNYVDASSPLHEIKSSISDPETGNYSDDRAVGLFQIDQFKKFKGNLGGVVTPEMLEDQIGRVRAPTAYEAANYLIPTPNELNFGLGIDSFGTFSNPGKPLSTISNVKEYVADIYAPLYTQGHNDQNDVLFENSNDVLNSIIEYRDAQKTGMENYITSLNIAAGQVYYTASQSTAAATGAEPGYRKAALGISDIQDVTSRDFAKSDDAFPQSCNSLAGQFWYFYYGSDTNTKGKGITTVDDKCPKTLKELLEEYFASAANDSNYDPVYYKMNYYLNDEFNTEKIYSAYMPGPYNGVSREGLLIPPPGFPNDQKELMRRNSYSTKLVTIDSLRGGGGFADPNFVIYSEGGQNLSPMGTEDKADFQNTLEVDSTEFNSIKH